MSGWPPPPPPSYSHFRWFRLIFCYFWPTQYRNLGHSEMVRFLNFPFKLYSIILEWLVSIVFVYGMGRQSVKHILDSATLIFCLITSEGSESRFIVFVSPMIQPYARHNHDLPGGRNSLTSVLPGRKNMEPCVARQCHCGLRESHGWMQFDNYS